MVSVELCADNTSELSLRSAADAAPEDSRPKIDTALLMRARVRRESEDPSCRKSTMDIADPILEKDLPRIP